MATATRPPEQQSPPANRYILSAIVEQILLSLRIKSLTATATPPTEQESPSPDRYIPPEIVEQILLNLPIKSLIRCSFVSKLWKSIISDPQFTEKRYRRSQKTIFINDNPLYFDINTAFSCPLSSIGDATGPSFSCPFRAAEYSDVKLRAFCDELWCVAVKKSTYLWNPSSGTFRKLPHPPPLRDPYYDPVYGLGYDAVNDDYKLLKICSYSKTYLYSSRNNSWKYMGRNDWLAFPRSNGECVNGALHWLVINERVYDPYPFLSAIVAFDFSTESYKELPQPQYSPVPNPKTDRAELIVLRGMLCVFLNYKLRRSYKDTAFVLWVMKEYGVEKSWTKMYEIRYKSIFSDFSISPKIEKFELRPLYLKENGEVVIWVRLGYKDWEIVVYKDKKVLERRKIVAPGTKVIPAAPANSDNGGGTRVRPGFVYVESIVSPFAPTSMVKDRFF